MPAVKEQDLHDAVSERLKASDQRYTRGRRALVDVLASSDGPLTIVDITKRDSSLALSSAYRNLVVLEEAGVVDRIVTSDEFARFELGASLGYHHHHLVCTGCGEVRDFTIPEQLEEELERTLRRIAKRNNYEADVHRLDLVGLCPDCR
jgi:Fe2+ or Zn2+ uptake regulation protein